MTKLITTSNERYILACILNSPDIIWDIGAVLGPKDFSLDANKYIFVACRSLIENSKELDDVTIENAISEDGLKQIGKISPDGLVSTYIQALRESPHAIKNLEDNVQAIKKASVTRQLVTTFDSLKIELVEDDSKSVAEMVAYCEDRIVDLGITNESIVATHQIGEGLREFVEERAKFPVEVPGIRTGFTRVDRVMGGLMPGQLTVVVARSKTGKSALLLNMVRHIAVEQHIPILMLDTEMPTSEVNTRLLSMISDVEERKIITGLYSKDPEEVKRIDRALGKIEEAPIYHIYMPEWDFDTILAYARKYKVRYNIGALFFDYIKLPDRTDLKSSTQEYQHLGLLTTDLKNKIAGKMQIPVVTAGQFNRVRLNETPDADQIAGSDRILHYANHLIALNRKTPDEIEECQGKANLTLSILASRSSSTGSSFDLYFKKPKLQIFEISARTDEDEGWECL